MIKLGVAITAATVAVLAAEFQRVRHRGLPAHGWFGLVALAGAEYLMFRGIEPVATYFTPIAWTSYILIADAALAALTGRSRLRDQPAVIARMALLSIPLWMIFEAYNLRLANWTYIGLPENFALRWLGDGWSFATITPAILLTSEVVEALGWFEREARPVRFSAAAQRAMVAAGAVMLLFPVVLPQRNGAYLFALVWLGFIFLLDPLNHRRGWPSLVGDLAEGRRGRFYSLLVSGWVCGWLWEFWNYWAAAKWWYIFPMFQSVKVFEMPALGFLGFLPFALECFVLYVTAASLLGWKRDLEPRIPRLRPAPCGAGLRSPRPCSGQAGQVPADKHR